MTLDLSIDESRAVHTTLCMNYGELPRQTRRILDVVLLQMRRKEPSLLRSELNYRAREPEEEHSG